jgi:hypothetical protein
MIKFLIQPFQSLTEPRWWPHGIFYVLKHSTFKYYKGLYEQTQEFMKFADGILRNEGINMCNISFPCMAQQPLWARPSHYRGFTITLRHTTQVRTPLNERPARSRGLSLKTHKTHKRPTSLPPPPPAGFETSITTSERPQTYALDLAAPGIGSVFVQYTRIYFLSAVKNYVVYGLWYPT